MKHIHSFLVSIVLVWLAVPAFAQSYQAGEMLDQAEELIKRQDLKEARHVLADLLIKEPQNYQALLRSGWICDEQEQYGEALEFLGKAAQVKSDEPEPLVESGFANSRLGRADDALSCYQRAISKRDSIFSAWHGLGDVYFDLKQDVPNAAAAYLRAFNLRNNDPVVNYRLGWCFNHLREFDRAEQYLKIVADHFPGMALAQGELGFCYLNLGEFDSARDRYEKALALDDKDKQALYFLGEAYIGLENRELAMRQCLLLSTLDAALAEKLKSDIAQFKVNSFFRKEEKR